MPEPGLLGWISGSAVMNAGGHTGLELFGMNVPILPLGQGYAHFAIANFSRNFSMCFFYAPQPDNYSIN